MRAIILAAGQGTRLRPLTDDRPKCLVELAGVSLLQRQVSTLRRCGISDIRVVTGFRAEKIAAHGYRTVHNPDYATTNMVGSLVAARPALTGDSDLVICYGDIVFEPRVLRSLLRCAAPVCMVVDLAWRRYWELRMSDPLQDAETLRLDAEGRVREVGKKPSSYAAIEGQYVGLIKVRADYVARLLGEHDAMDRDATYDGQPFRNLYMTSFLQHLIDQGWHVQSVPVHGGWVEVDTLEDLALYRRLAGEGRLSELVELEAVEDGH